MGFFREFKEFAFKGNVIDLAIGIIIGGAFGTLVKSLVDDVMMPVFGFLSRGKDFRERYWTLKHGSLDPGQNVSVADARGSGAVIITYGQFLNAALAFLLVAFSVFLLVKAINKARRPKNLPPSAPTIKDCPFCYETIPIKATRCPRCTSQLPAPTADQLRKEETPVSNRT